MKIEFDRQFGIGRRTFTLLEDYKSKALGVALKKGVKSDGASNPNRLILIAYMVVVGLVDLSIIDYVLLSYFVLLSQLMDATGWFLKAFIYHDSLYQKQAGKLKSDYLFLKAMIDLIILSSRHGVRGYVDVFFGIQIAGLYFLAVVCCGWFSYSNHSE